MERESKNYPYNNFEIKYTEELVPGKNPVWFMSQGCRLQGNLFTPDNFDKNKRYPAIVTSNPAGAIKEHSAGLYSKKCAMQDLCFSLLTTAVGARARAFRATPKTLS